jgi:Flp pilus assembly protein TadG
MRRPTSQGRRRLGVAAVETAMVMFPLMLLMFSIFEYGRFLMIRNLVNLSAETGCRYAVAHNTDATILTDVQTVANQYMAGFNNTTQFASPCTITVYAVPSNLWNPSITSVTSTSWTVVPPTHAALVAASDSSLAGVNGIQPGGIIAVQVQGNFKMMFPTLLFISPQVPMTSMVIFTCEGT